MQQSAIKQQLTRVILVRHGRSTFNDQGRYQGSSNDSVLTPKGIETARRVGYYLSEQLARTPIDIIYTSPLQRVQQTAREIIQAMDEAAVCANTSCNRPSVAISYQLKEISLSHWEGLPYAHVRQQFPEQYQCWLQRPHLFKLPVPSPHVPASNGSSPSDLSNVSRALDASPYSSTVATAVDTHTYFPVRSLYQSAQQFWKKSLSQHLGRTVLVVSHSATIHALISTALGLPACYHHSLQQSNCGISELTFEHSSTADGMDTKPIVQLHRLNQTTMLGESLPKLKVNKQGLRLLLLPGDGLTVEACSWLSERVTGLPIDFCLAVAGAEPLLHRLMQKRSDVLYLGGQQTNFLDTWQQWLSSSPRPADGHLMTGLAIAPIASIQGLLAQVLGLPPKNRDDLDVRRHHLSVVHYPHAHRPVVQAINID